MEPVAGKVDHKLSDTPGRYVNTRKESLEDAVSHLTKLAATYEAKEKQVKHSEIAALEMAMLHAKSYEPVKHVARSVVGAWFSTLNRQRGIYFTEYAAKQSAPRFLAMEETIRKSRDAQSKSSGKAARAVFLYRSAVDLMFGGMDSETMLFVDVEQCEQFLRNFNLPEETISGLKLASPDDSVLLVVGRLKFDQWSAFGLKIRHDDAAFVKRVTANVPVRKLVCQYRCVSDTVRRCARCFITAYCSEACQIKHWPVHKEICSASLKVNTSNAKEGSPLNTDSKAPMPVKPNSSAAAETTSTATTTTTAAAAAAVSASAATAANVESTDFAPLVVYTRQRPWNADAKTGVMEKNFVGVNIAYLITPSVIADGKAALDACCTYERLDAPKPNSAAIEDYHLTLGHGFTDKKALDAVNAMIAAAKLTRADIQIDHSKPILVVGQVEKKYLIPVIKLRVSDRVIALFNDIYKAHAGLSNPKLAAHTSLMYAVNPVLKTGAAVPAPRIPDAF